MRRILQIIVMATLVALGIVNAGCGNFETHLSGPGITPTPVAAPHSQSRAPRYCPSGTVGIVDAYGIGQCAVVGYDDLPRREIPTYSPRVVYERRVYTDCTKVQCGIIYNEPYYDPNTKRWKNRKSY